MLIFGSLALFIGAIYLLLFNLLHRAGGLYRVIATTSLQALNPKQQYHPNVAFKDKIAKEPWAQSDQVLERCLGALRWTMDQVHTTLDHSRLKEPEELLKFAAKGGGVLCYGMAVLFQYVLSALGIYSRILILYSNLFNSSEIHATVEVLLDGKWVVFDPTFHISFTDTDNNLLSATDIRENLFTGRFQDNNIKFYGEVAYPIRVDKYYINIFLMFNNIFVLEQGNLNLLAMIPPWRYWYGPKLYYQKLALESDQHLRFWQWLYLIIVLIIPISLILLVILFIIFKV